MSAQYVQRDKLQELICNFSLLYQKRYQNMDWERLKAVFSFGECVQIL